MNPILLYDGLCGFCDFWVRLILRRDARGRFRFAAFQSQTGRALCLARGLDPEAQSSLALIAAEDAEPLRKSDAVLAVLEQLGGPWGRGAALLRRVPRSRRDALYDFVARNRYRWFGRRSACRLPSEDPRFLP